MKDYQQKKLDDLHCDVQELKRIIQMLQAQLQLAQKEHQETRNTQEQLAACFELEYSQDIKDWISKKKLTELKKHPRDNG